MLSGESNENGKKNSNRSNQQKSNFARAAHFFVHFFAVVLHDCNVKRPKTSWLHVLWRKCGTCSCSLFFSLSLIFTLVAASIPPLQNFMLFLQQKLSPFIFCLSRSLQLLFSLSFAGLSPYFLFFSVFLFLYISHLWTWQLI